jgi:sterol desaturase/sphingolipid hydroxylase (fatty acid hydroxylase superfamily)
MPTPQTADFAAGLEKLLAMAAEPFLIGPGSRLHYINFIVYLACGAAAFWLYGLHRQGWRSPISYIFPKDMYLSKSSLVDFKLYVVNHFVSFKSAGIRLVSVTLVSSACAGLFAPLFGSLNLDGDQVWALAVCALLIAMANDFATYLTHRLSHEHKVLWPFHKVHHSAEVLTPLTLMRKHPIYGLLGSAIQPLIAGPVIGLFVVIFDQHSTLKIMGINAVYMIFNFAGANLRHSHIWISFGPVFSRIFISPAMHQIHHSIDPKHYDRNYGEVFALWDWMFGTLYIPKQREELAFGLLDDTLTERVQPHPTLKEAYLEPIRAFAAELKPGARPAQPAPVPAPAIAS